MWGGSIRGNEFLNPLACCKFGGSNIFVCDEAHEL